MSQTPISSSPSKDLSNVASTPNISHTITPISTPAPTAAGSTIINSPTGETSESKQELSQAKSGIGTGYLASPQAFSYQTFPNMSASSGNSQLSPSGSAAMSNPTVSSVVLQHPLSSPNSSSRPFSSYVSQSGALPMDGQQFQTSRACQHIYPGDGVAKQYIPPDSQNVDGNATSYDAVYPQSPLNSQYAHPISYTPGTILRGVPRPVPSPVFVPNQPPSNSASFSYNGNSQQMHPPMVSNATSSLAHDASGSSHVPSPSSYPPGNFPNGSSSTFNMGVPPSTMPVGAPPSFHAYQGMPGTPRTPGPPGVVKYGPQSGHFTISSASMNSSTITRPHMPSAPVPSNPLVPPQLYPTYPSLPAMAASPLWMQSAQTSNLARPPFGPYPSVPGSFSFPGIGTHLPSVSLPHSEYPGVTPFSNAIIPNTSHAASEQQLPRSIETQPKVTPGIDSNKNVNDIRIKDEGLEAWTAHKSDTGVVYYYNVVTRESTYKRPSGFKEPDKVTVQTTPVSWGKLEGTDWTLVSTNDGKKYYYNTKTKLSSWQIPTEVAELGKKQVGGALDESSVQVPTNVSPTEKESASISLSAPAINTGGRDATAIRSSTVSSSSSALDMIKKKLQDSGIPITPSPVPALSGSPSLDLNGSKTTETSEKSSQNENNNDKLKDANGDSKMSDSSSDSEDEEREAAKELCITQFKEMLKERGVAPFSKWEKELPKIVFDPRFKAVPSHAARRSLFDHFVKTRAEEERKEKRAAQKAAIEGFKQLIEEASKDIDLNTDYHSFRKKWGKDPRFEIVERKDRELLLNERIISLKKAAEEKVQAIREAAASSFKSMLQEKGDITITTRWAKVKDSVRDDPRYKSVKHEDREILFKEFISGLKSEVDEADQEEKAKRLEQEKLKERERELRKRKERDEEEMDRVRLKARRKEAISSYQALLVETIKDPQSSWSEAKVKLEKDPQGRANNPELHSYDLESLFREHIKMLRDRCTNEFKILLSEVITPEAAATESEDGKTVFNSWTTAKRLLKSEPRFTKMPRKESESIWRRYTEDIQRKQKLATDNKDDGTIKNLSDSARHLSGSKTKDRR